MKVCHARYLMTGVFFVWIVGALAFMWMMHADWVRHHGVEPIYLYGAWGLFMIAVPSWGYLILNCVYDRGG